MTYDVSSIEEYLLAVPEDRRQAFTRLWQVIKDHIPHGFQEGYSYGMIGFDVPLSTYPEGYHVTGEALPFIGLAAQKNHIALYHMGIYMDENLEDWFRENYAQQVSTKLDMGKSCIRFKDPKTIPYDLIADLVSRMDLPTYVDHYERVHKNSQGR